MRKHKLADGDPSPIIINDSSTGGGLDVGVQISHPNLLHGYSFKVFDPGLVVESISAEDQKRQDAESHSASASSILSESIRSYSSRALR